MPFKTFDNHLNSSTFSYIDLYSFGNEGHVNMKDMQEVIYDGDEYAYPKIGESDAAYEARMAELRKKRNARMTDEERSLVADTLKAFVEIEPTLSV